jgi:hypothetical protein
VAELKTIEERRAEGRALLQQAVAVGRIEAVSDR